jgi:hypothetical protein
MGGFSRDASATGRPLYDRLSGRLSTRVFAHLILKLNLKSKVQTALQNITYAKETQ